MFFKIMRPAPGIIGREDWMVVEAKAYDVVTVDNRRHINLFDYTPLPTSADQPMGFEVDNVIDVTGPVYVMNDQGKTIDQIMPVNYGVPQENPNVFAGNGMPS